MQALDQVCSEPPLAERVDTTVALFISPDSNLEEWISRYTSENSEGRIVIPLSRQISDRRIDDEWRPINALKGSLFIRDLFDYKLTLKSGRYFYGREGIVATIIDNVGKSRNSGLLGLGKPEKLRFYSKLKQFCAKQN